MCEASPSREPVVSGSGSGSGRPRTGADINAAVDRAVIAMMNAAGVESKNVIARGREGVDRKLSSRITSLRQWEQLTSHGLEQWNGAREVGLPPYDHPREDLRGGLERYKSELRDAPDGNPTPWKAFFLKWVVPEIEKQYVAKEQPAGGSCLVLPRIKKYDLVEALDKGVIAMLRAAGVSPAGVTARSQSGRDKKLDSRVHALREWDRLRASGLHEWNETTQLGLPEYDPNGQGLRGGPKAHLERCDVDKPWRAFYLKWVLPELERQEMNQHQNERARDVVMDTAESILSLARG